MDDYLYCITITDTKTMAITIDGTTSFVGQVITTREHNYYDDSDFVAVVWDAEEQRVYRTVYATTRYGLDGVASADLSDEYVPAIRDWCRSEVADRMREEYIIRSTQFDFNKLVESTSARSRKFPKGVRGWCNKPYMDAYRNYVVDIDPENGGNRVYDVALSQLTVVNPEQYIPSHDEIVAKADDMVQGNIVGICTLVTSERGMALI